MSDNDKNKLTTTGIFADVAETKKLKLNTDIVDYATADAETKAKMDTLIASLDSRDLNSITTFAKEPSEQLGTTADGIIKQIQHSNSFLAPFEEFTKAVAEFDFETVGDMAREYTEGLSLRRASPLMYGLKKFWRAITFQWGKDTSLDDIRHEIDKSLIQLGDVMASLEEASDDIPGIVSNLDTLKASFTEAYSDYGLYIGAALEKLRRMEEEEIPQLQKEAANSLLKQEELQSSYMAMTILNKKITNMDNFHKQSLLNLARIRDMKTAIAHSKLNIDEKLTVSEGEWKGILASNAVAAEVGKIVDTVSDADEYARKIREQGVKVAGMINEKVAEAMEAGTVDAARMVELLKNKAEELRNEAEVLAKFNQKQKDARADLDAAGRELLQAAQTLHVPVTPEEENELKEQVKLLTYQPGQAVEVEVKEENEPEKAPVKRGPQGPQPK